MAKGPEGSRILDYGRQPWSLPRWVRRLALASLALIACAIVAFLLWDYIPGTLRFDSSRGYLGTGWAKYNYPSGARKLEEHYRAGRLTYSRWLRPDGSTFAETVWDHGRGTGYFLRDDGTPRVRMEFVDGRAEGEATYFDQDGNMLGTRRFRHGKPIEPEPQTMRSQPQRP